VADTDPALLEAVFARRRETRIANARARLTTRNDLGAKVTELTRILDEDGYLATSETVGPGVYRIVEHNCAIWAVAQRYGQACTSELDFIRAVLDGATVERVQHMVAGARHCAYEVRVLAP
jgi:DeoR family suf operon transcriptional repressor